MHMFVYLLYFYNFRGNAATSVFAYMHVCNYWDVGGAKKQGGFVVVIVFFNRTCVVLFCVLFLAVDGLDVAVDSFT
jgi:hypothetical protein